MAMTEGTKTLTGGCTTDTANIGTAEPRTEIKVQTQRRRGVRIKRNNKGLQVGEGLSAHIKVRNRQSEVKHIGRTRVQPAKETSIRGWSVNIIHGFVKCNMLGKFNDLRNGVVIQHILHCLREPKEDASTSVGHKLIRTTRSGRKRVDTTTKDPKKA
jgi:hypothetical protein